VRRLVVPLVVLAALAALTGCGAGGVASGNGNVQTGKALFTGKAQCGACHTLADAGTQGTEGPNLDAAFAADREQGFKESTILNVVLGQIRDASAPMPKNLVKGQEALDVATYVASVAGVNGAETKPAGTKSTDGKTIFTTNCASCHTLAAAKATGTVGPNLDQLKPAQPVVVRQVTNGGGVMPAFKGKLMQQQIDAVATFVADNAGK
jgi:mono/diheme cytochrome c family protein